jgi:hypothetical protein
VIATTKGKRLIHSLLLHPLSISIIEIYVSDLMVTGSFYTPVAATNYEYRNELEPLHAERR